MPSKRKKHKYKVGQKFQRKWTKEVCQILAQNRNTKGQPCYSLTGGHEITEGVLEKEFHVQSGSKQ